jgi:glutathione S-transferase
MKLFGSTNKRSYSTLKIRAALAEAGAEYEFVPVDLDKGEQKRPAFLAVNPHGKIPALLDGDFALAESDAILFYVADKHPAARLAPALDGSPAAAQARARVLQWCAFASTALYAAYAEWWNLGGGPDPAKRVAAFADAAIAKVDRALAVMQAVLAEREFIAGPFSIADLSNAAIIQSLRARFPADPIAKLDRVAAWHQRITARPAWKQANAD